MVLEKNNCRQDMKGKHVNECVKFSRSIFNIPTNNFLEIKAMIFDKPPFVVIIENISRMDQHGVINGHLVYYSLYNFSLKSVLSRDSTTWLNNMD